MNAEVLDVLREPVGGGHTLAVVSNGVPQGAARRLAEAACPTSWRMFISEKLGCPGAHIFDATLRARAWRVCEHVLMVGDEAVQAAERDTCWFQPQPHREPRAR